MKLPWILENTFTAFAIAKTVAKIDTIVIIVHLI